MPILSRRPGPGNVLNVGFNRQHIPGFVPTRRNQYDQSPTDQKAGDPNDLLSAGGRWTFVLGAARVPGYLLASTGEYTITTTEGGPGDSIPVYNETELVARAERVGHGFWEDWDPNGVANFVGRVPNAIEAGLASGDVVELGGGTGAYALYGSIPHIEYLEGLASAATTTVERFVRGLIGLAIPMVPDASFEIWGVLDSSAGLLVSDYVTDNPFTVAGFDITGHSGLKTQLPPAVLGETAEALSRETVIPGESGSLSSLLAGLSGTSNALDLYRRWSVWGGTTRGADGEADTLADENYATGNAYRGRLTATVTIPLDVLSTGSLEYLIASGSAPSAASGELTRIDDFQAAHGLIPDPRSARRYAYSIASVIGSAGYLVKYDLSTATQTASTDLDNTGDPSYTVEGPANRYSRFGEEEVRILGSSGYMWATVYDQESDGLDYPVIVSIDSAEIVAELDFSHSASSGSATPKLTAFQDEGGGSFLICYYYRTSSSGLRINAVRWTGGATITLVSTTTRTIDALRNLVASDQAGIFYFSQWNSPENNNIYKFNTSTGVVTIFKAGASLTYNEGFWHALAVRQSHVVGIQANLTSVTNAFAQSFAESDGSLVDTVEMSMDFVSGIFSTSRDAVDRDAVPNASEFGLVNPYTDEVAHVTVAADGTLAITVCSLAGSFDIATNDYSNAWPVYDAAIASFFLFQDFDGDPYRAVCGTPASTISAFTLAYWIEQFAINFLGWEEDTEIDASTLTDTLYGFQSDDLNFQRDIADIREVFDFYVDDHDGTVTCKRSTTGSTPDVALAITDLVRDAEGVYVQERVAEEDTLPQAVQIEFTDAERLYIRRYAEPAIAENRSVIAPNRIRKYSIPFAMLEADVKALQWRLLWNIRAAATTYSLTVQSKHLDITPGTVISFPFSETSTYTRVAEVTSAEMLEGDIQRLECRGVKIDKAITVNPAPIAPTTNAPSWSNQSTIYIHLDIPYQGGSTTDQDGAGIVEYGVITSDKPYVWDGGYLYRRDDANDAFVVIHDADRSPWWGTVATPLGSYDYTQGMDEDTTLVAQMVNGSLSQIGVQTEADAAAGVVKLAYGRPGRWEILYPRSMVHQGNGVVWITDFYRGQEGTEAFVASHQAGDYLVMIDLSLMLAQTFANADITLESGAVTSTRQYKATGYLQSIAAVTATTQALSGASHTPYAPELIAAAYSAGSPSVLELSCVRRDRFPPFDAFDPAPNSDRTDNESPPYNTFILRIYTYGSSPPDRTVIVTADDNPSWEYSEANQVTDFGAKLDVGDEITMSWRQVRVMDDGRELYGREATATVTIT